MRNLRYLSFLSIGLAVLLSLAFAGTEGDQGSQTTFSGQATAVRATVLGITTVVSDTGPLPPEGGTQEVSLLEAEVADLLSAEVLHAATVGQGDRSRSEASVAKLTLTAGGHTIASSFLRAHAAAVCQSPQTASVEGNSEIVELVINQQSIAVSGEPNQTILLPNGRVVINEQFSSQEGRTAEITVNALHVVVDGVADVVIASAYADIACGGFVCVGGDFVTGGGWITGTPTGARANFAVAGGIKHGEFWGHLTYIDHGQRLKVKGTAVTAYVVVDDTTRIIEGQAEVNGQGGFTYRVQVSDQGEPGRHDHFQIDLSNGYYAAAFLQGGNIQLHRPCR